MGVGHPTLPPVTAEKGCGHRRMKEKKAGGPGVGEMSGDLVGRATSAFLILRREDPQKVPEPRGRKSGDSQASWGGVVEWRAGFPGDACTPEPGPEQRPESRLSPGAT